jgi:hypothetical protein
MNTHPDQFRDTLPPDEVLLEPTGQFGADLGNFRSAVHRAAERETSQPVPFGWLNGAKRRQRTTQRRLVLAWGLVATCAALLFVGTLPSLHHARPVVQQPIAVAHSTANDSAANNADDTALLEQVDTAVSESVPTSLAPLDALDNGTLDSWNSSTSTNTETPLKNPEKKNVSQ